MVIAVPHPNWCGTLLEIGAALSHNILVVSLGVPYQRVCVLGAPPDAVYHSKCQR